MKLALNTKHSTRDTQGNVTSVPWWVLRCPWHTIVSCPNHTAQRGNSERNITCTKCIFTQWLHIRFESWVNFQNVSLLTFSIYAKKSCLGPGSNQRLHAFQRTSLPPAPSMFNINRQENKLIVCKYIPYFQSLIYFQTELLTRVKFSCHVWTGFCGPTGDGKWSSQKFVNLIIRNSRNIHLYQVSQILLATSSRLIGVSCLQDPLFESWWFRCVKSHIYTYYPCICQKFWKLENRLKFGGFQNFQKIELKILSIRVIRIIHKKSGWGGYRDSARLLGESWWPKKWGAIRGKKMHKNREIIVEWTVGVARA